MVGKWKASEGVMKSGIKFKNQALWFCWAECQVSISKTLLFRLEISLLKPVFLKVRATEPLL